MIGRLIRGFFIVVINSYVRSDDLFRLAYKLKTTISIGLKAFKSA